MTLSVIYAPAPSGALSAAHPPPRAPLALVVDRHDWAARAFESVLGTGGFAVVRAASGAEAVERARAAGPDLVLARLDLPDMTGMQLCRMLREEVRVGATTPIFLTSDGAVPRAGRMEALRAGAWGVLSLPTDAEELVLRLGVMVRGKLEADRAREESLVDPATGLYSVQGLLRRVRELAGESLRHRIPLACAVLAPGEAAPDAERPLAESEGTEWLLGLVQRAARHSDVVGRLSRTEFAVLAPHTDAEGMRRMAERLLHAAGEVAAVPAPPVHPRIRIGCYAVPEFGRPAIQPVELLVRATMALRRAQSEMHGEPVCFY